MLPLSVKDIRVEYDGAEAIKGVSLEIDQGKIVTLIGANGAGKSTILRAISGLKRPRAGEIWFEGKRIDMLSPPAIVKLGISHAPEGRRLFPFMTVLENLKLGAFLRDNKENIAQDLEDIFAHFPILKDRRNQQAGTLSGGEQQMLAIGRALMARPKLLMLDEPSLGLAPMLVEEIAQIISVINQSGMGIVLVEQNAQIALRLAHRAYVIETGRIALQGDAKDLLDNEHVKKAYLGG
jgi:branched-chain amino acid transport system ATP-binding protein